MPNITAKKKPVIQKGNGFVYNPETFYKEHHVDNFHIDVTAQEILDNIKPFEFLGRKFLFFDTETHPYYKSSADVPKGKVRRWVGSGKTAKPQDFPFSFQVCDLTNAYCMYSDITTNFSELKKLAPLFLDPTIEFVAHNVKFDMHQLANADMKIVGKLHDTVVLAKLVNENRSSFELRSLAAALPKGIVKFEYMVDTYKQLNKITDYRDIPKDLLGEYGCADVWNCGQVFVSEYLKMLEDDKRNTRPNDRYTLESLYEGEMEDTIALYAMERRGMRVDADYEAPLKEDLQKIVDEAEAKVYEIAGRVFNMNSTKQIQDVMLSMGVDPGIFKYTDKGNIKLDKDEMARLDECYHIPIISSIQAYKKAEKLLTTYAVGIYSQADSESKVHGSINQTEATTGRMSITKPALQTLPKKDKRVRKAFIPEDDSSLWFFDLDQVEYRLYAHYSKASSLIEAINNGFDVHASTAALIKHKDLEEFMKAYLAEEAWATDARGQGKTINFALVYGVGIEHLAELLHCSVTEATQIRANYFAQFPEARIFINTVFQVIKERGFVKNFYGRRRHLDVDECYKAPNSLIQGCAADFIKKKLVKIYKFIQYNKLSSSMRNIIHDELVLNIPEEEAKYAPVFRWLLSEFTDFRCAITAGAEQGCPSWGQKEDRGDIGFQEPDNDDYLSYDVYDGSVFDIDKEVT